ncbi:recombination protein rad52 [Vittaforma corneae ATCC 50505]|uniref:Recombination protein rad52 n=1 Tax=Vittaforma corneae (strain ATCC 50505) TaxID=993615 RepID=L2GLX4_VITCO|nr:recombination protein rad52 [Vittaforma corneae ATCC 50505]ELA41893.1 recombination protein rad52 [Vittaforma corneae ATCC 50505]
MPCEFSQKQKERIAKQLDKSLGPEYLSVRAGFGSTQLTYVEGWMIISLANKIFGFDGWSSEIKSMTEEYCETNDGKTSVGYTCVCRVTLRSGAYKEDVGFGSADNQKMKGPAVEKAKKEAATDALKRALRQFGNALGNCCYDKEYIKNVRKQTGFKKVSFDVKKILKTTDLIENKENFDVSVSFSQDNDISDL